MTQIGFVLYPLRWRLPYRGSILTPCAAAAYDLLMRWQDIITFEPGKRSGQPCIRGMRITVWDILDYLAGGMTMAEVLADFDELTSDDIRACFAFASDLGRRTVLIPT